MKQWHQLLVVGALWAVWAAAALGKPSIASDDISYDEEKFAKELRVLQGYRLDIGMFRIVKLSEKSQQELEFSITFSKTLCEHLQFFMRKNEMLVMLPPEGNFFDAVIFKFTQRGSVESLNVLLSNLVVERKVAQAIKPSHYPNIEIQYSITRIGDDSPSDLFLQTIILPEKPSVEVVPKISTIYLNPGKPFSSALLEIREPPAVWLNQSIVFKPNSPSSNFYSLKIADGTVFVEGKSPQRLGQTVNDRASIKLDFTLKDGMSGQESELYTFYLEIDPEKLQANEQFKLIFLTAVICTFVIVLFICLYLILRREKTQQKEEVKQVIQAEVPENILTKSILEWNKEVTSTRDHTTKDRDSVFYNPYDKYSLKKRDGARLMKTKQQYSSLKTVENEKPQDQSHSNQGIITNSNSNKENDRNDRANPLAEKKKLDELFAEQEARNISQLEFSKVEDFHTNVDRRPKDFEFGDLSKIVQDGGAHDETAHKKDKDQDLQLEDIILKEI